MKLLPTLVFLSLATFTMAELLPPLQTLADKQKAAAKTIFDERVNEVIKIQDPYIAELKAASTKAAESGNADVLKILSAEQERLERGVISTNPQDGFPKGLLGPRKTYLRNYERLDAAYDKRRKELDSGYLMQLGSLRKEHADDTAWIAQLESEKKRLLAGAWGPISDMKIGLPGTKWLNNGDGKGVRTFNTDGKVEESGQGARWDYDIPDEKTVVIHWGGDSHMPMHLQKDGKTLTDSNGSWTLLPKGGE